MSSPAYYDDDKLPLLVLPTELEQELASNVRRAFGHAVKDLLGPAPSASSLRRAVRAVNDCIQTALAMELRDHNERAASHPPHRLPTELWVMIWAHLPMVDCIAVTHVCHSWRATAVASRRLWSVLEFRSSAHGEGCQCHICDAFPWTDIHSEDSRCTQCDQPRPAGQTTDPAIIQTALARSVALPLTLHVDLPGTSPAWASVKLLYDLLKDDATRVTSLRVSLWETSPLSDIFETLPDLVSLQSLHADSCVFTRNEVESLSISIAFASLRDLRIQVGDYTAFLDALRFHSVTTLHIELANEFSLPDSYSALDSQQLGFTMSTLSHLRAMTISNISSTSHETLILSHCRSRDALDQNLQYQCPSWYSPYSRDVGTLGFEIFADLDMTLSITIAGVEQGDTTMYRIGGSDGRGFRRDVTVQRSTICGLWKPLPAGSITSLDVHLHLWKDALATLENPLPAVRWLTLRVRIYSDQRLGLDAELIRARPLLPALECVTLSALDAPPRRAIVVSDRLTGFLRALRDDGGIGVLVLRGLYLGEVNPELLKIFQDVRDAPGFVQSACIG